MEETVKVNNENVVAKQKENLIKKQNLLLAVTAKNQIVGIKIDHNRPDSFENDEIRLKWDHDACNKAKETKKSLEMGVVTVEELGDLIDFSPNITKKQIANLKDDKKIRKYFNFFCFCFSDCFTNIFNHKILFFFSFAIITA